MLRQILCVIATLCCSFVYSQLSKPDQSIDPQATLIYLEHCNTLSYDEMQYPGAQLLTGDVLFRHDSALMYCDSAYFYESANSLNAFGNIRFEQGDTLFGYGDVLYYDGNIKLARLRHNVRLVHFNTILTTDSLNYDRVADMAYYFNGGNINDSLNTLTSVWGQYEPPTNQATFKDSVYLTNPNFTLESDTLQYNTNTHIAQIVSLTTIIYQEQTTIKSDLGWYNTENEQSTLLNMSRVEHADGRQLTGDSILYDKRIGVGRVFNNMELTDTVNMLTLYGNYGEYYEHDQHGFATDSALAIDRSDSIWLYVHADTLFTEPEKFTIRTLIPKDSILVDSVMTAQKPDTLISDTSFQRMRGYRNVRVYRDDMQALCDSMSYTAKDSLLKFYYNPIAWSDSSQLSADSIRAQLANGEVDHVHCYGSAMAIQQEENEFFNQLSGKEILAWVRNGELRQIDVNGNAETVFFPREDQPDTTKQGDIAGVNKTQSSYVKIFLNNQKIERVLFTTATTGTMYPLDELTVEQTHLGGFFVASNERPINPDDVFRKVEATERPTAKPASATDNSENSSPQQSAKSDKSNKPDNKSQRQSSSFSSGKLKSAL